MKKIGIIEDDRRIARNISRGCTLAMVVIGALIRATILTCLIFPVIYRSFYQSEWVMPAG
ncbi:hypothetical protein [Fibrella arboris]|uniref:hypothetical protein n=1 Tax=Fibrella arboris TaxID=3242486 RepID=UPI0035203C13